MPAEVFKTLAFAQAGIYRWLRIPRHPNFRRRLKIAMWMHGGSVVMFDFLS